jgi:hypothetical protein
MHFLLSIILWLSAGVTLAETPLYAQPGDLTPMTTIPAETNLTVEGRSASALWLQVRTPDASGWVRASNITLNDTLFDLPITGQATVSLPSGLTVPQINAATQATLERLQNTPIFVNFDVDGLHDVFQHGQAQGNRARIFIKLGDSNTTSGDFLRPMGMVSGGCDYGNYAYLQETIAFFNESPRPRFDDSFDSTNITAQNGLSTAAALDPFWAPAEFCQAGESPIDCEHRIVQPAAAVIMIGLMDLEQVEVDFYQENLALIVEDLLDKGIIPIITTFTVLADYPTMAQSLWPKSIHLNAAMLDVAEMYDIPLINLWAALQDLPDFGIGADRTHLRHEMGAFCDFTGPEQSIGGTLRNLLTLQGLDYLRRNVLESTPQSP